MEYISKAQAKRNRNKGKSFESYVKDLKRTPTGLQFIENAEVLYDLIRDGYSLTGKPITRSCLDNYFWGSNLGLGEDVEDLSRASSLRVLGLGSVSPFSGEVFISDRSFYFGNTPFSFSDRFGRYMKYLVGVGKVERVSKTGYIPLE
jgi:hypothetical protein